MKQEDFEEYVKYLQNKKFVTSRRPSAIIGNFYMLVTIVIMSICIIIYVNYVVPSQDIGKNKKENVKKINNH